MPSDSTFQKNNSNKSKHAKGPQEDGRLEFINSWQTRKALAQSQCSDQAYCLYQGNSIGFSQAAGNGFMLRLPSFVHCRSIKDKKMFQTLHQFTHHAFHKNVRNFSNHNISKRNARTSTTMPATTNLDTASPATTKQAQLGKSNITATIVNGTGPFHNAHHADLRLQLCNIQYTKDLHAATDDENCHSK